MNDDWHCGILADGSSRRHRYDEISGWCLYCGNSRDDGRVTTFAGNVFRAGATYTAEQLDLLRDESARKLAEWPSRR